jgi:hypothetical protein
MRLDTPASSVNIDHDSTGGELPVDADPVCATVFDGQ